VSGRMVHSYSKISSLCRKYGLLAGKDWGTGRVAVWGGSRGHMIIIGIILTSDDWGDIERCVVELSMSDAFGS
jgi:hypothetical protein